MWLDEKRCGLVNEKFAGVGVEEREVAGIVVAVTKQAVGRIRMIHARKKVTLHIRLKTKGFEED